MHSCQVRHHHAAYHDEVEMCHHEIRVRYVNIDSKTGYEQPGHPTHGEQTDESERIYNIGVCRKMRPLYIVAVQLKTLMADGTATK